MALIFSEGFDAYGSPPAFAPDMEQRGWQNNGQLQTGRIDGYALGLYHNQNTKCILPANEETTKTVGFAMWPDNDPANIFHVYLVDGATTQCRISINASNFIEFYRGTTLLATGTSVISSGAWYYIEIQTTIDNTVGAYEVRINGATEFSDTGVDTQMTSATHFNALTFGMSLSGGNYVWIDDIYVLDDTGSYNNDFLGPIHIETLLPDGDGGTNQWATSTGLDHYAMVDESPADDDTTYLADATTGQRELFDFPALSVDPIIHAAVSIHQMRLTEAECLGIKHVNVSGVTTTVSAEDELCTTDWVRYAGISEENPNTSTAWTKTTIDAAQFGFEVS